MQLDRRRLVTLSAAAAATPLAAGLAEAAPQGSAFGIDASRFGIVPGRAEALTRALQRAIDQAADARRALFVPPGVYRTGRLRLRSGSRIVGMRGATRLVLAEPGPLLEAVQADHVTLEGLVLDGAALPLAPGRGLVHLSAGRALRLLDCEIVASGRHGIALDGMAGEVRGNAVSGAAGTGIFSIDARGLVIAGNTVSRCGNNGIQVWRSAAGHDGTLVAHNRIEEIFARDGGSGQNGNGVNVFRAHGVIVAQNQINGVAFSAVRGNAASALQVTGNSISGCGEVAVYAEFGFEGAVIAHNTITGAAIGIAVTNFNEGGRMAVVQGNIIRHLVDRRPSGTDPNDSAGIGIGVEADTAVTGNVIEGAPNAGIMIGWGRYLRDVTVTGNVVRGAAVGVAVSVASGAGTALIADNLIAGASGGAIVGMEEKRRVTGDLAREGVGRHVQLGLSNNRVR